MCFDSLVEGDATEKPLRTLLRAELGSALANAGVATVAVGLMLLLVGGVAPLVVGAASIVALAAGVLLHQAVLVAGVAVVRWRAAPADTPTLPRPDRSGRLLLTESRLEIFQQRPYLAFVVLPDEGRRHAGEYLPRQVVVAGVGDPGAVVRWLNPDVDFAV